MGATERQKFDSYNRAQCRYTCLWSCFETCEVKRNCYQARRSRAVIVVKCWVALLEKIEPAEQPGCDSSSCATLGQFFGSPDPQRRRVSQEDTTWYPDIANT